MSYCRFSEADVYLYLTFHDTIECCGCRLGPDWDFAPEDIVAHLEQHIAAGHYVPGHVIPAIRQDITEGRFS